MRSAENYLKEKNIRGRRIKLDTTKLVKEEYFIIDDSITNNEAIATNGHHTGVESKVNGEKKVFDNHRRDPVPIEQWMNNLTFYSKECNRASCRESGYKF